MYRIHRLGEWFALWSFLLIGFLAMASSPTIALWTTAAQWMACPATQGAPHKMKGGLAADSVTLKDTAAASPRCRQPPPPCSPLSASTTVGPMCPRRRQIYTRRCCLLLLLCRLSTASSSVLVTDSIRQRLTSTIVPPCLSPSIVVSSSPTVTLEHSITSKHRGSMSGGGGGEGHSEIR